MEALSIVIQGPIETSECSIPVIMKRLRQMRVLFPLAEIILSTWCFTPNEEWLRQKQLKVMGIKVIQSPDPGPLECTDGSGKYRNNINRLLVSTQAGLAAVTRPLTIKMRSDCFLSGRAIIGLLNQFFADDMVLHRQHDYAVFSRQLITSSWVTRDARGSLPYLFHPGDIFIAGRTEDVRLYFSAPLATTAIFSPVTTSGMWCAWRYVPEQWLWVNAIFKQRGKWVFDGNFSTSSDLIERSERYFLSNFIVFNPRQLALHWPKYRSKYLCRGLFSTYNYRRWRYCYNQVFGTKRERLLGATFSVPIFIWRQGYRFRVRLLRNTAIRRIALCIFSHR
ncbi:hypothetical protein INI85_003657 [Salmonella enterica]|nr:hypothetical protein [Salmonella enterica subsp. enterica serovar Javiana]EEP0859186.1 hypothetical protein [Salmonella enterica]EGH8262067.1 hypothetical protein [Salmonella enterica]EGL2916304.1 hypothetical protein [Salmonella enterica]EJP9495743.1 hypothetical protein [Salmonella enterica]